MTNKEAKEKLYMEWQKFLEDNLDYAGISKAYKLAFKALDQDPVLDKLTEIIEPLRHLAIDEMSNIEWQMLQVIDKYADQELKTYQEPTTGHWTRCLIRNEKGGCIGAKMICSKCGNDNKHDEFMNYCPNCGAKMLASQESEG